VNSGNPSPSRPQPLIYEIRVRGTFGREWTEQLGGMDVAGDRNGDTVLSGPVVDQAALHALLRRLRDLGVTLISINAKEEKMPLNVLRGKADRKMVLSTLWIFVIANYIYADIFNIVFNPAAPGSLSMTDTTLVVFALLMETGIAMILLSRILPYGWNRWLNMIVGVVQTVFVIATMIGEPVKPFYLCFVCIEVATSLFITVYAATWRKQQAAAA
jgi:hypothetical protein